MFRTYENLENCCGGNIAPESIGLFQRAMVEYEILVSRNLTRTSPQSSCIIQALRWCGTPVRRSEARRGDVPQAYPVVCTI
jgi:hypothetical protein